MNILTKQNLVKIRDYIWEIPKSFRSDMRVPARIFASEEMLAELFKDRSLWQLTNLTTLPGIYKYALVMPDAHEGYGAPIGGIAAFDIAEGIISPGLTGYDVNCGVRLLISSVQYEDIKAKIPKLTEQIFKEVPSGVGRGGFWKLNKDEMKLVLNDGAKWLQKTGEASEDDLISTESEGKLDGADPDKVSQKAKDRGRDQLGTLGAGNHFVEIQQVAEIYDDQIAQSLGLEKNLVTVLIHCGSRGLGHQVATDYIRQFLRNLDKYKIELVDKELACAPFHSAEGQDYLAAMKAAANFAWANRQLIAQEVRKAFRKILGESIELSQIYDVAHNIIKVEEYTDFTDTDTDLDGFNTSAPKLLYEDLTYRIRRAIFKVYNVLGSGHKEHIYANALVEEFKNSNLQFEREKAVDVIYKGKVVGVYKPDFVIEDKILLEIKSLPILGNQEKKQVWSYLQGTNYKLALLVNFGHKEVQIDRIIYTPIRENPCRYPRKSVKLAVHRKGATRAFPPGHFFVNAQDLRPEIHLKFQKTGQPTLIPGSMGTASYVLVGQPKAMEISFGSAPHGAGRLMSRSQARKQIRGNDLKDELEERGISIAAGSLSGLAEEAPAAYKDVNQVVDVVHNLGIAKKVAKLAPVGVIKG